MTSSDPLTPAERRTRSIGVGCLMTFIGFFSMAMVGVLASVIVAKVTRAAACPDIPSCNWYIYALWGGVLGAVTLPVLVVRRLNRPKADSSTANNF